MLCLNLLGQNCFHLTSLPYLSSETNSCKYKKLPNIVIHASKNIIEKNVENEWPTKSDLFINICLIILDICAKLFVNPTRGSKDIERTRKTVIQCLILDCDLDLEPTLVKHRHCTLSHHTWHLCKVICKSHQGFKRYRADMKYSHTMFNL